ncbi:ATP-dependent RNA helicase DHX8, putative [Entamoeba invadens IP1]|uniref:RNA helicase n=1 Tax=Entamoeba invadens IP1 TaxID=370355 RepID=A0A0A1U955_ENTIV|nr:ATP-dependent RNA helicase DHX8, putative [Entamoeba invadens IP1]ELP91429.1 ATP-dependent RNA helicase DHX8, putative [Entamoeba invadens IP1]|eukprot:XP_004258200.1 ATP-dependent RNA helicase DHX8, putative [Entamoeba invadens IP1]
MDVLKEMSVLNAYCKYLEELYGTANLDIAENILAVVKKCNSRGEFITKFEKILTVDDPEKLGKFFDIYDSNQHFQKMNTRRRGPEIPVHKRRGRETERVAERRRDTSEERAEMEKLVAAGVMKQSDLPALDLKIEEMTVGDVELNIDEPDFLKGKVKQIFETNLLEVNRQPEGHLQRSAQMSLTLAKKRRDTKTKEEKLESGTDKSQKQRSEIDSWRNDTTLERRKKEGECKKSEKIQSENSPFKEVVIGADEIRKWEENEKSAENTFHKSIQEKRKELPIFSMRGELMEKIKNNQILIIIGETGCGKTTQITQYLDEEGYSKGGRIGCTQPRRVATISVSQRVSEEMGCKVSEEVGYYIRFDDRTSRKTRIKYMTDGMLLREYLTDPDMKQYSVIILDEAHERTVGTDILFGLLKQTCLRRKNFKLIVTSATLEAEKFSEYFLKAPIVRIPGRTYPVTIEYLREPEMDYVYAGIEIILQIHMNEDPGDILFFLTGQEEIDNVCNAINAKSKTFSKNCPKLKALPIYAALPTDQQKQIFEPAEKFCRKCVVATNIAETSITIDGIKYVVDSGFVKQNVYNPKLGMDQLLITPISQACASQRSGRAGRTGPGKCFRLYTEAAFDHEMTQMTVPEIQRANLETTVLLLKAMGIQNVQKFDFMDPPVETALYSAMHHLFSIGALDDNGELTRVGTKMSEFPLEPPLAKMLISSEEFKCSEEAATVVAALSVGNFFYRPKEKAEEAERRKKDFENVAGDQITLLHVYNQWIKNGKTGSWCKSHYINLRSLLRCEEVRNQIVKIMKKYNIEMVSCGGDTTPVLKCIVAGFFVHAAKRDAQEGYRTVVDGQQVFLHPTSALFGRNPEWVVYHELVLTSKEYMRETISIDPKWLIELAPAFYQVADGKHLNERMRKEKIKPLHDRFNKDQNTWKVGNRLFVFGFTKNFTYLFQL